MAKKWIALSLVALTAGTVGFLSGSERVESKETPLELVDLQRRLTQLERDVRALSAGVAVARRSGVDKNIQIEPPENSEESAEAVPAVKEKQTAEEREVEYWANVDDAWDAEPKDARWGAEGGLHSALKKRLPSSARLESLDCRTSMCRVEMTHASMEAYNEFVSASFIPSASADPGEQGRMLWSGATLLNVTEKSAGGGLRAVAYLVRENHALPSFPEEPESL